MCLTQSTEQQIYVKAFIPPLPKRLARIILLLQNRRILDKAGWWKWARTSADGNGRSTTAEKENVRHSWRSNYQTCQRNFRQRIHPHITANIAVPRCRSLSIMGQQVDHEMVCFSSTNNVVHYQVAAWLFVWYTVVCRHRARFVSSIWRCETRCRFIFDSCC